mgnify:CR=1 FL=1
MLTQNDVKYHNMEYLSLGLTFCRADMHQGTTHHDSGYDVTIATSLLPDLYLLKRKNALFVSPESNRLSCVCAVYAHIHSHPRHKQQGLIALLEGGKL